MVYLTSFSSITLEKQEFFYPSNNIPESFFAIEEIKSPYPEEDILKFFEKKILLNYGSRKLSRKLKWKFEKLDEEDQYNTSLYKENKLKRMGLNLGYDYIYLINSPYM